MKLRTFENLFSSEGEKGRVSFAILLFCNLIVMILNVTLVNILMTFDPTLGLFSLAIALLQFWVTINTYFHRMQDIGLSGGWLIAFFIPFINGFLLLYLLFRKGQPDVERKPTRNVPPPDRSQVVYPKLKR